MATPHVPSKPDGSKPPGGLLEYGPYLTMGFQLAAAVVVFYFVGNWLDGKLQTAPWCSIGGAAIGFVGGTIKFVKTALELSKRESDGGK